MENTLIPIIVTIGISTLIVVVSVIGTFVALLNHLSARMEQSEARMNTRIEQSEARMNARIDQSEARMTRQMERFEDKVDVQFETLRRELRQSAAEQPVAGDD